MERVVRLYQLWSWLPHFRAIAETEHLPSASTALGISPSALSRALKQLEAEVGTQLFVRDGRDIRINPEGEELLRAVRAAMRGIDDALTSLTGQEAQQTLRVAAPGPLFAALVLDVIQTHRAAFPHTKVELSSCSLEELSTQLSRGAIDVCIHEEVVHHDDLQSLRLGGIPKVVACSKDHPLAQQRTPLAASDIKNYSFAAPRPTATGVHPDGWPADVPRTVDLIVSHMQMGIDACERGHYIAVLPKPVAQSSGLCEVPLSDMTLPTAVHFATTRRQDNMPANLALDQFLQALLVAFKAK